MYEPSKICDEILKQRMKYDEWLSQKYGQLIDEIIGKDAPQMKRFTYMLWAKRFEAAGFAPVEIYQCLKELHTGSLQSPKGYEAR